MPTRWLTPPSDRHSSPPCVETGPKGGGGIILEGRSTPTAYKCLQTNPSPPVNLVVVERRCRLGTGPVIGQKEVFLFLLLGDFGRDAIGDVLRFSSLAHVRVADATRAVAVVALITSHSYFDLLIHRAAEEFRRGSSQELAPRGGMR